MIILCKKLLTILLIGTSFLHLIFAQIEMNDEVRADSNSSECPKPNQFPLFGPDSCISREAYTAIFLTSIILAGISFLMLTGLLIMYCVRRSKSSSTDSISDTSKASSSPSNLSIGTVGTPERPRKNKQETGTITIEDTTKRYLHQTSDSRYDTPDVHRSTAPYTVTKPVSKHPVHEKVTTVVHKETETLEMAYRPSTKPYRAQPAGTRQKVTDQVSRNQKNRHIDSSTYDENLSSQF
ncbi:hypothetical protein I4U23_010071 [Adineta vaga]|nr:hypothetical protein I4U23_010071 [Adineta vaga]